MKITISQLFEGAEHARGLAVIIDVFRAFSLECYLFDRGAERVLAVRTLEKAYELQRELPDAFLVGERHGKPLPGFDCGNSPSLIRDMDITGRTVIHTTSAGTKGIAAASGADEVITGSLVNASAIARYISRRSPEQVSLVGMGLEGKESSPEDVLCAEYIRALLRGETWNEDIWAAKIDEVRRTSGERFFEPDEQDIMPREDFFLCTQRDIFPFVIRATARDGYYEMQRVDPEGTTF